MNITTYFRRVFKYVIYLTVLLAVIFLVMDMAKMGKIPASEILQSQEMIYFGIVVLIFSLLHPLMGFTKKGLTFDARKNQEEVERVMAMCGYQRVEDKDGVMQFRAASFSKRLLLKFEDTIEIKSDDISVMSGPRREVVRAAFRMTSFIG